MVRQDEIVVYLDEFLRVSEIPDYERALNGLQVANSGKLTKLVVAVDACLATIKAAAQVGGDLLLVHHGLFWGGLQPITGAHGRRVRELIAGDVALYSAHIPLDCHARVGNNAVLARDLGLTDLAPFGRYEGVEIGVSGTCELSVVDLAERLSSRLGAAPHVLAHGPKNAHRVAIVTGAGSDLIQDACRTGIDTLITGEGPHHSFFEAEESGMNLIFGGHYATETVGVQALAKHLEQKFGLSWAFVDHPTGL